MAVPAANAVRWSRRRYTEQTGRLLEALLPPDRSVRQVYDHHEALMLHGQKSCFFRDAACPRYPVLDLCPTGQARLNPSSTPDLFG